MNDPIAALSSGLGAAAIALIRMSGDEISRRLQPFLRTRSSLKARQLMLAQFIDPKSGETIDDLLVAMFPAPHSFTGEDVVELSCHGGPYVVQRILELLLSVGGFRQAEPGEFTKRAFLNGKMDLSSAEGIKQLVEASTHQQWLAARYLATGRLAELIEGLREKLLNALAFLAARIDFPDEGDTRDVELQTVVEKVKKVDEQLSRLEASYSSGRIAAQGLRVTILGQPNMGKSTLMNTLLGHDRAIVSEEAGTTRDYLEEPCRIKGRLIRIVDTAGIRATDNKIEQAGVSKALELAEQSDLVLLLLAVDATIEDRKAFLNLKHKLDESKGSSSYLLVQTKADLQSKSPAAGFIPVSCAQDTGIEVLQNAIAGAVDRYVGQIKEENFISSPRHFQAIANARKDLDSFFLGVELGHYDEMLAFEMQNAARSLSSILGHIDVEDVLDHVFRDFCVGK